MKTFIPYFMMMVFLLSGCTQMVTAPISIVGSAASATIDVAGSTAGALTPDD